MPKPKRAKPIAVKKARDPQQAARARRVAAHLLGILLFAGLLVAGTVAMKGYVDHRVVFPAEPAKVVLKDRPVWMSDFLADQIARSIQPLGTHSTFDHNLLVERVEMLKKNPWVKDVREVRRAYGNAPGDTLEVDCDYRAPLALVQWGNYFWLVDGDGAKLPDQFTAQQVPKIIHGADGRTNIRIIAGVKHAPPDPGQGWIGEDLASALDLVKLLYGQPYAQDILKVDVTNFAGRHSQTDAQIVLQTRFGTEIRWGRPINAKDFFVEIPTAQKLDRLSRIYEQYHRVDARQPWIDVRFDETIEPEANTAHADTAH